MMKRKLMSGIIGAVHLVDMMAAFMRIYITGLIA